jgi:hypothetical protein
MRPHGMRNPLMKPHHQNSRIVYCATPNPISIVEKGGMRPHPSNNHTLHMITAMQIRVTSAATLIGCVSCSVGVIVKLVCECLRTCIFAIVTQLIQRD